MSVQPLITFKAGQCAIADSESTPLLVKPEPTPGYVYLYPDAEDEMIHFCWRSRSKPADEADLDLLMIRGDGTFQPYTGKENSESSENVTSPTRGRVFVLKFQSSSQRHFFWMQSKPQHQDGHANWFSPRDLKIGQVVDMLLQGEDVNVHEEMQEVGPHGGGDRHDGDEDQEMEDATGPEASRMRSNSTGGAGPNATGGDIREEGEESREGGADGGRAATTSAPGDASSIVQNFLRSLNPGAGAQQQRQQKLFTSLADLLTPDTCLPVVASASPEYLDNLLAHLPPRILLMAQEADDLTGEADPSPDATAAAIAALSVDQKRNILSKVLRSPQLHQSLGSLTSALREGGLPLVAQALDLKVDNGGAIKGGNMPLGGGEAVEAFVEGVRRTVLEDGKKQDGDGDGMDTS